MTKSKTRGTKRKRSQPTKYVPKEDISSSDDEKQEQVPKKTKRVPIKRNRKSKPIVDMSSSDENDIDYIMDSNSEDEDDVDEKGNIKDLIAYSDEEETEEEECTCHPPDETTFFRFDDGNTPQSLGGFLGALLGNKGPSKLDIIKKRIAESSMTEDMKEKLNKKLDKSPYLDSKQEEWFEQLLSIPFGKFSPLPIDITKDDVEKYFIGLMETLNKAVYKLENVKEEIINYVAQCLTSTNPSPRILALQGVAGVGKCLHPDTPVMLYDGTVISAKDVKVGDQLMGDDSDPRNVLSTCTGTDEMYKIVPTKGDPYVVNSPHILSLKMSTRGSKMYKQRHVYDIPVNEFLKMGKSLQKDLKGYKVGVDFDYQPIFFDPYMLGYWLGDGSSDSSRITTQEDEVIDYFKRELPFYGLRIHKVKNTSIEYTIAKEKNGMEKNFMTKFLEDENLLFNKHVPKSFLCNTRSVRLQVLAGLLDSDGHYEITNKVYEFVNKSKQLFDDFVFLCRSLGYACNGGPCQKYCWYNGEKREGTYYRCNVSGNDMDEIPVLCFRKKAEKRIQIKDPLITGIKIEPMGVGEYCGFQIDGNRRFLLGDFTVTHNTQIVRNGIAKVLGTPMQTFSMGGIKDSSHFVGFDYTYQNSKYGAISQALIDSEVMNPVIFLDELDKISDWYEGEEIKNLLIHMTDPVQNHEFKDKYFEGLNIDLSKVIFIFAFNDIEKINPILRDRLHIIKITNPTDNDKLIIANNYVIDELLKNINLSKSDFTITDGAMMNIIQKYSNKNSGIRSVKDCIRTILLKVNTLKLLGKSTIKKIGLSFNHELKADNKREKEKKEPVLSYTFPIVIDENNVDVFLGSKESLDEKYLSMYM